MCSAQATEYVPIEFWYESMLPALNDALENYIKYKDRIDDDTYRRDFIKCLVSLGVREIKDPMFSSKVELSFLPDLEKFDSQMLESFLFFI